MTEGVHSNRRVESQLQMAEAYCDKHTNEYGVGTYEVGLIRSLIARIMEADEELDKLRNKT